MKFKVLRHHIGDKEYFPGDTRDATENDVKHLIGKTLVRADQKDEPKPQNKAEGAAAKNKAS